MLLEEGHEPGEVEEGTREAVDAVDDHAVDLSRLDVREEALEGGSLDRRAAPAAVRVVLGEDCPPLAAPGPHVVLAGEALGV